MLPCTESLSLKYFKVASFAPFPLGCCSKTFAKPPSIDWLKGQSARYTFIRGFKNVLNTKRLWFRNTFPLNYFITIVTIPIYLRFKTMVSCNSVLKDPMAHPIGPFFAKTPTATGATGPNASRSWLQWGGRRAAWARQMWHFPKKVMVTLW